MSENKASSRGATRKRSGLMPIASIASTSSETCIVPELRGERRSDARREHDPGEQRSQLAGKSNCNQSWHQSFRAEALQLVAGQERHGEAEEEGDHRHERHRPDARAFGVPEKTRGAERSTPAPHVVHRFREGVYEEPKDAADPAQKTAPELADLLHDDDRIGLDRIVGFSAVIAFRHDVTGKVPQLVRRERGNWHPARSFVNHLPSGCISSLLPGFSEPTPRCFPRFHSSSPRLTRLAGLAAR